jgi:ribosomal-protein-alanine N-acetyltransferase
MIAQYLYQPFPAIDLGDIVLREIVDEDAEDYFRYMSRPEMTSFLTEANCPKNLEQALEEIRYWGSLFRNKRSFYWGIALKDSNKLIGTAGFNMISIPHGRAEISYDLDYEYWGKGMMLKSIKNILKFADYALKLTRVQATVITDNERSIKVLERCGFVNEGTLKKYEVVEGQHKDYYMYAKVN